MKKKNSEPTCFSFCQSFYVSGTFPTQEEKNNPIKIDNNFDVTLKDMTTSKDMTTCENMCQSWNEVEV